MASVDLKIPDIGGATATIIELPIKAGDAVAIEQTIATLEGDKATMEVPASAAGTVREIVVKVGDEVGEGSVIARIETAAVAAPAPAPTKAEPPAPAPVAAGPAVAASADERAFDVAVIGAGPGGYTAAFRAADLGLKVALIERYPTLGGVCLNVGCIPSKALLHAGRVIDEAHAFADLGIRFGKPEIELDKLRAHKERVVGKLTTGLAGMSKQRGVTVIQGDAQFSSPHTIDVTAAAGAVSRVRFTHAIIAAGSQPIKIPGFPWDDPRLMDSTDALALADIPKRLLIVGGGIIGLEMACVYDALGSKITVVELLDQLMPGADPDLIRPFEQRVKKHFDAIKLKTKVARIDATPAGLVAHFESASGESLGSDTFDRALIAVGRSPNGKKIGAEKAGVTVSERGYIAVDAQQRTNVPHIFAIGDIVGNPMLAHKATHEAKVAAEVAAGKKSAFVAKVIPSVAYTDPEIAWVGVTEAEAKAQGLKVGKGVFPYAASGRAIGINRTEGFTKLIFDEASHRIVGAGIVGPNAGDLISEAALAIEMGCDVADIALTIHPHPTLSESVGMAAEVFEGTITDLYIPKKKAG
jgi:dihydrolipoamide dehydrogenase